MEVIASILGGLVGGLFTFLGVFITIRHDKAKEKRKEQQLQLHKQELVLKDKPCLEIIDFKDIHPYCEDDQVDVSLLLCKIDTKRTLIYESGIDDCSNWTSVEYLLKNTGKTEIDHMYFSSMMRNVSILEESHCELYHNNNLLNIYVLLEKKYKAWWYCKGKN